MNDATTMTVLHSAGEAQERFRFECAGGAVGVMATTDRLTPYGGVAAWSHYLDKLGVVTDLAQRFPVPRTSPNATPVADVLLVIPAKLVESGRQKTLKLSVGEKWWDTIAQAYARLQRWLAGITAPQLGPQQTFERYLCWNTPLNPDAWLPPLPP